MPTAARSSPGSRQRKNNPPSKPKVQTGLPGLHFFYMEDQKLSPERRMRETGRRLKPFCKFATAVPLFLLLLQKKKWQKENEPEGISISPQTPLNRPGKPLRFSWIFPAKTGRYEPRISSPRIPSCLSLWDRCLSEAKTERVDAALKPSQSPAATALSAGKPRGYANTYHSANFDGSFY